MAEYQKYLDLIEMDAVEEAAALQNDIQEGLEWVGLTWADLEFAFGGSVAAGNPDSMVSQITIQI